MQSYKLSFTAASLALPDSIKVAEVYLGCKDWGLTREFLIEKNLIQSRTIARNKRVIQEILLRLIVLSEDQLTLLVDGSLEEQRLLLWFNVCKVYLIIREFAQEVLHEKFLTMNMNLSEDDFLAFYLRKLDVHPELEKITLNTQNKIRTQLFRMLRESGLINQSGQITRVIPSSRLSKILSQDKSFSYSIYPAFKRDFED